MKQVPIRLGPLALLLTVVTICMTVLGILTFSTARADLAMAEKLAESTQKRYRLEEQGQAYLREIKRSGGVCGNAFVDGVLWNQLCSEDGKLSLSIGINGEGEVVCWQYSSDWQAPEEIGGLWLGD